MTARLVRKGNRQTNVVGKNWQAVGSAGMFRCEGDITNFKMSAGWKRSDFSPNVTVLLRQVERKKQLISVAAQQAMDSQNDVQATHTISSQGWQILPHSRRWYCASTSTVSRKARFLVHSVAEQSFPGWLIVFFFKTGSKCRKPKREEIRLTNFKTVPCL